MDLERDFPFNIADQWGSPTYASDLAEVIIFIFDSREP
jgi:dTDP-4-dehydrorhamnose reductase